MSASAPADGRDAQPRILYVVEHLDPELEQWSALEYKTIAQESIDSGAQFMLSSVSESLEISSELRQARGFRFEHRSIEEYCEGSRERICLLDPAASQELSVEDANSFDVFLFGGILGDDPPRDRTSELRKKGFVGRRLGPIQMTTDTAVRATRLVIQSKVPLSSIPYIDFPELKINGHESIEMPFRYVKDDNGKPIMPEGMMELIKKDSEKGFGDLL